jgi:curved DNA-binding protein CbpA
MQEAYEVLSDDDKRTVYDLTLPAAEAKTYVKPLQSSFSYNHFFTPIKNTYVEAIALSAHLDYSFVQACFDSQSDGRFERIVNLAYYISNHNKKRKKEPALSLDQALTTTLQESINLRRAYPLIRDGFITIEQAKAFSDQQSDNIGSIGIAIVRDGLLKLHEMLSLSKIEFDYLYETFTKEGRYNLKEAVSALKIFQDPSRTLQYK